MTEPLANKSGFTIRKLADQLKTVFVAGLVSLFAAELMSGVNVPLQREPWWHFVMLSVVVLFIWWFLGRKKLPRRWWWGSLCGVLGYVWVLYGISGIQFPTWFFLGFAILLFLWTLFLLFALVLTIRRRWEQGKMGKVITLGVKHLDSVSWPLEFFVLLTSVFLGWVRLLNAGAKGCWMDALLVLGIMVILSYAMVTVLYPGRVVGTVSHN